jgi:uncharacterized membrane protein
VYTSTHKSPHYENAALGAITLLAAFLRIYGLGTASLWYDEGATLWFSEGGPNRWISDTHPPLYYALVHFWLRFGNSEYWLRLLSFIPAVATIPIIYCLGKRLFGAKSGLISALFMALMAFHVDYSRQARMYTFFVFFFVLTFWSLLSSAREGRRWHWFGYIIAGTLLAYTQGIGILYFAIIACLFPLMSPRRNKLPVWIPFTIANVAVVVGFVPWLIVLHGAHFRVEYMNWVPRPTWLTVPKTLIAFLGSYIHVDALYGTYFGVRPLLVPGIAILFLPTTMLIGIALRRTTTKEQWRSIAIAASVFTVPIVAILLISVFFAPIYIDRVLLPSAVGLVLILGAAVSDRKSTDRLTRLFVIAALVFASFNTVSLLLHPRTEDFRSLSRKLQSAIQPEDSILYVADSGLPKLLVEYYDPNARLAAAPEVEVRSVMYTCKGNPQQCLGKYLEEFRRSGKVWIVYAHDASIREQGGLQGWLDAHFSVVHEEAYAPTLRLAETRVKEN